MPCVEAGVVKATSAYSPLNLCSSPISESLNICKWLFGSVLDV